MTPMTDEEVLELVKKKVSTAKIAILTNPDFLFYGTILTKLKFVYTDKIKTAAVDGIHMIFNPKFMVDCNHRQTVFVLMHELKHMIYRHIDRKMDRDHELWNIAGDYVINNFLDHKKFDLLPGVLLDHKYDGMDTDQVYMHLKKQQKDDPNSIPKPDHDDLLPPNMFGGGGNNAADNATTVTDFIDKAIAEAMVKVSMGKSSNKAFGNIPGDILRDYESRLKPTVPWTQLLQRFLFGVAKTDYSFRRPHRRSESVGFVMPSLYGQSMDYIDFAIDTSGSVSEEDFSKFISEIHEVFKLYNPENIGIHQFDDIVQDSRKVCSLDEFKDIKFKGGGGTTIGPVLNLFKDNEAKALVILTDGYFSHNANQDPKKPVVWCIYNNQGFTPEFGEAVHFTLEN